MGNFQIARAPLLLEKSNMANSLQDKVVRRLRELDRNPFEAARIGSLERSFVNDIVIGKKQTVRGNNLWKLALALDVTPGFFLNDGDAASVNRTAIVMGHIGAGAEIFPDEEQVGPDGLFEIEAAIPLPEGAVGFEVVGDSMYPRYDPGDVVICAAEGIPPENIPDGEEVAIRTSQGKRYLKRLLRTAIEGVYNLESHNAGPIRGIGIEWVSDIWTVVRAKKWRRLSDHERRKIATNAGRMGAGA
jgi:hypothetical protein